MIHHERVVPPAHIYPADEWNIVEKQYSPEFLEMTETIFAMGNGYFGMRGCSEEGTPVCNNGTYVNGFYDTWPIVYGEDAFGFARTGQTIVNVTDAKTIKLYVDDEPFYLPRANLVSFDRRLNFKAGTLDREIVWETPAGKQVLIRSRRLVSFQHRHLAAIHYHVEMLNAEAPLVLSCEMATPPPPADESSGDPRKSKGIRGRVLRPLTHYHRDRRVVLCHGTERSGMTLACATDHVIETECTHSVTAHSSQNSGEVVFRVTARPGQAVTLVKYVAYHTSGTAPAHEMCNRVERTLDRAVEEGFPTLEEGQQRYMDDFWHRSDVRVSDIRHDVVKRTSVEVQQAMRFNLFHILQASARSDNTGVPAKGLTGDAYEGHYFWDTEIYLLPFLIYTAPRIAKNLLLVRYNMLDQARARARELGHRGAMFPWRTISGEEASAYYAAGTAQYHINADIAYALRKYVNATGDQEFLERQGAELLIETARMWVDLGFFSERKGGKFCINGVTGPDEYNTVVDNNTYTNLMARENLRYAAQTLETLRQTRPDVYSHIAHETDLAAGEMEEWTRAADNMFIPYDEASGIYPQDDGFMDKERLELNSIPPDRFPLLLFYHPLVIYRHQVIKQADIILAMFLLQKEFTLEAKRRNFHYYDPLTTGDSSLSSCIQAIIANEISEGRKSIDYARASLLMDLADVGGNVKDGCHIAAMGGSWMIFAYGYAGMQDYDGVLTFRPRRVPEETARMRLRLTYRGQLFEIEISTQEAKYTLIEGNELVLRHEDDAFRLTPETPIVVRPVRPRDLPPEPAAVMADPR
jgi:alpha,alpha-trehalose phosphorylase